MFPKLNEYLRAPDDGTGSAPAADPAPTAAPAPAAPAPESAAPGTVLYPEGDKAPPAPADDAAKVAADKRKAELDAMSPEDRAKAEKEDADKKTADETAAKLKEVPEDGKYEFTLPDGVELDAAFAEKVSPALKEAGITREQANKLAAIMTEDRKAQAEGWAKTQEEWVKSAKADKEFGGDKFDASIKDAKRVLDKFGTSELKEYLTASGGGNHPELIRFMARVGNAISDDSPPGSETPAGPQTKDHADILYGPN